MFNRRTGFTLIELLIVVIVLGVLAAAAMPRYQNFVTEARSRNCMTNLRNVEQAVGVWETRNFIIPCSVDYPLVYVIFHPGDGSIATGTGLATTYAAVSGYTGPVATAVVAIVQEEKTFVCPEVINRYGSTAQASVAFEIGKTANYAACPGAIIGYTFVSRFDSNKLPVSTLFWPTSNPAPMFEAFAVGSKRNATCNAFGLPNSSDTKVLTLPAGAANPIAMRGRGPDLSVDFMHYSKK